MKHDTKGADRFRVCYLDNHEERKEMFVYATTLKQAFINAKELLNSKFGQNYLITDCRLAPDLPMPSQEQENNYVAWCRFSAQSIQTCDSDAPGAFKVYRWPLAPKEPK